MGDLYASITYGVILRLGHRSSTLVVNRYVALGVAIMARRSSTLVFTPAAPSGLAGPISGWYCGP